MSAPAADRVDGGDGGVDRAGRRSRPWRRALVLGAIAVGPLVLAAATALVLDPRVRHLALPVLVDPSLPAGEGGMAAGERAPRRGLALDLPRAATALTAVPGRVSALLEASDGAVWIGTFDAGLFRLRAAGELPEAVGATVGRERFVDALAEADGHIVAGTHAGAIVLGGDGRRVAAWLGDRAVLALAAAPGGALVLGTTRGLFRLGPVTAAPAVLPIADERGQPLRVTALACAAGRLWIGTGDGVYVHAGVDLVGRGTTRWQPLVFGAPGADSNVVTALAPHAAGVIAGTDDGGLVYLSDAAVRALPLADRGANEINPGAIVAVGADAWVGTEGAGLVRVHDGGERLARPLEWPLARVSAVAAGRHRLLVGSSDGRVMATPR